MINRTRSSVEVKPIETIYNGYRFRSRAEARWAVFFDALSIEYYYEPEAMSLPGAQRYLPDFYLPASDTFFEVKGIMNELDRRKISAVLKSGRQIAVGYPDMSFQSCECWGDGNYSLDDKSESWLIQCEKCGELHFIGTQGSWECRCCGFYDGDRGFEVCCSGDWTINKACRNLPYGTVLEAFDKARRARFEYGDIARDALNGKRFIIQE